MNNSTIIEEGTQYVMNTYARFPVALVEGKGSKVWDADGKEYLDFVGGLAVTSLGHCHPKLTAAIRAQSEKLFHCSNLYWIEPQVKVAKLLAENSAFDKTFFCNSGAEANEAAIKLARKYGKKHHGENCYRIITMKKSFHGRTYATLTATGQEKVQKGYEPLPEGFMYVPFNDLEALKESVTDDVCAIMLEPVQGEGGVNVANKEFLEEIQKLCKEKDILLIFDEVQCGMGRTGKLFCYQNYGVEPHIMTLAKALGGGTAIGAMLAKERVAESFAPGDHASTFGGNPLACAAAEAVITTMLEEKLPENAKEMGEYLVEGLKEISGTYSFAGEVRGLGLLVGMELEIEAVPVVKKCLEKGLLLSPAGKNVLRFLPPLNVTRDEIDTALEKVNFVFEEMGDGK
ncbi:MAG: acetylornithine/N-succinyldiaminopimelate aminotransferase [Clostridia bacterium]|nr:aspartate aminotransferase family protein [Clostridiales bacterium]MDK2985247.1 acetylornithine/N-succinyldiaminopimelate aminotransferase [Clostridia bacterium]